MIVHIHVTWGICEYSNTPSQPHTHHGDLTCLHEAMQIWALWLLLLIVCWQWQSLSSVSIAQERDNCPIQVLPAPILAFFLLKGSRHVGKGKTILFFKATFQPRSGVLLTKFLIWDTCQPPPAFSPYPSLAQWPINNPALFHFSLFPTDQLATNKTSVCPTVVGHNTRKERAITIL